MIEPESRNGIDLRADFPRSAIERDPFLIRCLIPSDVMGESQWKASVYDFAPMKDDAGVSIGYYFFCQRLVYFQRGNTYLYSAYTQVHGCQILSRSKAMRGISSCQYGRCHYLFAYQLENPTTLQERLTLTS